MSRLIASLTLGPLTTLSMLSAQAMVCVDQRFNQAFQINEQTGHSFQIGFPQNQGMSFRDPTGQFYMRLPAANPFVEAYFAAWDNRLILLSVHAPSPQVIGYCQHQTSMPPQPQIFMPNLQPSAYQVVGAPQGAAPIPAPFAPQQPGYTKPAYATEQEMLRCAQQAGGQRDRFMECAASKMFTPQQVQVYECVARSPDDGARAQCLASTLLGPNERQVLNQVQTCYSQNGGDWTKLPLCFANQQFDPTTQRTIGCLQNQGASGQASAWGTVACIGSNQLSMNPEMTIAVQCAATTGGDPMSWAGCTGGQLTQRELTKCLTHGVGGNDGCFGPNNTIVQGLNQLGQFVQQQLGPNNDAVRHFNNAISDVTRGPGPNNDLVRAANTVANDLTKGPGRNNDIRRAVNRIFPGMW
ncbi:hypothetical protein LU640_29075 [Pseudomonas monteilii]|uniref:hypothetical protein n=1 Tax=Pseudomonas monteilii TaxID=76759 RepID=UPI001E3FB65D|nr:hypothetical protein [Pseudomonas monteilii]MCE1021492.1 hypothetical protein [Pseudomonas monteilii]MCE1090672.1 hypothetical protein [Pseudomonas monteilii]